MEKTLLLLKPSAIQRGLIGEIISRIEKKGLRLVGIKMIQLNDDILNEHYAHLQHKPFFQNIKNSMMATPIVATCWEGVGAVEVIRLMTGVTNSRLALPGTIRGDFSMSVTENIVHTSDSPKTAIAEIRRFFKEEELFDYDLASLGYLYAKDEFNP
jgi:Nucleoside diphosphate kinase